MQFDLSGRTYRVDKLDAFKQLEILKSVTPLVSGAAPLFGALLGARDAAEPPPSLGIDALKAVLEAVGDMPSERFQGLLNLAFSAVKVEVGSVGWQKLLAAPGRLQYEDIPGSDILAILRHAIEENLAGFFPSSPPQGSGDQTGTGSNT